MANPFQQSVRQRKVVYLGLIVALFTASLLHRRLVVEKQAEDLQLRETARGEVELTSSFVRLSLTGSRGLATTMLWAAAIERQARNEWNELELLVGSISALQPYFITPWVFQSWNLAFNVAVECDRPRDKYYYVSRGLEFLAEGERRNQGTADEVVGARSDRMLYPGQPEMRYYMGFYYQLKIGQSDEKNTMRCLLDLSCIDPVERRRENFVKKKLERKKRANGDEDIREVEEIDTAELEKFCDRYPRLVRRLREPLGHDTPKQVVKFLDDNRDVPTRFKTSVASGAKQSDVEDPRKQFPILPPVAPREAGPDGPAWPRPRDYNLSAEALDIFLICRTWYQYAQLPLAPPNPDPGTDEGVRAYAERMAALVRENRRAFRMPRNMALEIFRSYPARAQNYIAEALATEGWFDAEGWAIKDWFGDTDLRVGKDAKYHAGPAWERAYDMYLEFGKRNGLYLSQADRNAEEMKISKLRAALDLSRIDSLPPLSKDFVEKHRDEVTAFERDLVRSRTSTLIQYEAFLGQANAERDPETILFRKLIHEAMRYARRDEQQALPLFRQAWPLWIDIALRYPVFAQDTTLQEDIYEPMLRYLRLTHITHPELFRAVMLGTAQMSVWPHPEWETWGWIDTNKRTKIVSVRAARGPLETIAYYSGPDAPKVRADWHAVTTAAAQFGHAGFVPPVWLPQYALAGAVRHRQVDPPPQWRFLVDNHAADNVRRRFGLLPTITENPELLKERKKAQK